MLCKSTEGKTTWTLPGLSFHTFLIFESASNTCAFMNNMDTVPNTHLFIVDNWISYLMNTATVMLKKGKRCHVCRHPHRHPCRYPYRQPCSLVYPSLPTALHSWTVCFNMGGRRENTDKQQKPTASEITLQAVMLPWNGDALTQPREILKLVFLTIPLFRLWIHDSREEQMVLIAKCGLSTSGWGETWHRVSS